MRRVAKPDRCYLNQVIKLINHVNSMYPLNNVMQKALYLCGLPLKIPELQSNHEENIRQTQFEGYSIKYLTRTPQNCQVHQKSRKVRNCHSQEEPKETRQLNVM